LGGLTSLKLDVKDLVKLAEAYVPVVRYAGVRSDDGFTVEACRMDSAEETAGCAGGFIGYGSGVQVSYSDVTKLKHTSVSPPQELEAVEAGSYFDAVQSQYAVTGGQYAGGYIGKMDVGDAASLGSGLKILGQSILLENVLSVLSVVVSTIEYSNVTGAAGGFAVLANGVKGGQPIGMAGGYAGNISGGHIRNSHVDNFSYIVGQISAGGYVGEVEPGNAANLLDDGSILGGLLNVSGSLLSVGEYFVPTVYDSSTACIPCGGAVRAQAAADSLANRGMAGGYVGHNEGGQIKNGTANRILSVYGAEYAGGFSGLMECADTAASSHLSVLYGLIEANDLLQTLTIVYPTEENTAVYGPLANLDYQTWNEWVEKIGVNGGYGAELSKNGKVNSQAELDALLERYVYGYQVAAGRSSYENGAIVRNGGCAGGYVGAMHSGVITNGQAHDVKSVTAMKSSGGFAGEMISGGAASLGGVNLLGLNLELGALLDAAEVFVPVIKKSSVKGYRSGLSVGSETYGNERTNGCGNAGGYVGSMVGGQIWGENVENNGCDVINLRRVYGTNKIGGYAGYVTSGSTANANTNASDGVLQAVLDFVIRDSSQVASVLQATVSTIRNARVAAADPSWGYVVEGEFQENGVTQFAKSAGGFAGTLEAAVIGENTGASKISVSGLRGVSGGLYAGGFFGLADVGSVASVSGNDTGTSQTTILSIIQAGEASVLDAFRTYIYYADVEGVADGIQIRACAEDSEGTFGEKRYTGNAGGFGGGLLNGSVKHCYVSNLSSVTAMNYAGGFIGHLGKNGAVDVDNLQLEQKLNVLGAAAGVLDIFGSHVEDSHVTGVADGFTVRAQGGSSEAAGGFAGYADLSKISVCTVDRLKKAASEGIAGGFVGRTNMEYVADVKVSSVLVDVLLNIVNLLVQNLYVADLENLGVIDIGMDGFLGLQLFSEGNALGVNLLGLKITAALSKQDPEYDNMTDAVIVTIGDSTIKLPCNESGVLADGDTKPQLEVTLIKGNRTNITDSKVTGIERGYDVYGGGAADDADGTAENGYSGGFVGLNKEGVFEKNVMAYCDVVRGTASKTGPFTGATDIQSSYYTNTEDSIEAKENHYGVYRTVPGNLTIALTAAGDPIGVRVEDPDYESGYCKYDVIHRAVIRQFSDWEDAVAAADDSRTDAVPLDVYAGPAKVVLMSDAKVTDNTESLTPEPGDSQDPCKQQVDLTIQKVWKDWNNWDKIRPDHIEVTIYQNYKDANGETIKTQYQEPITLTAAENGSAWSAVWQTVVTGLPVAFADSEGTLHYYFYTVEEVSVTGYLTEIDYDSSGFAAVITNRHDPVLPLTGGRGALWLATFALAVLGFGVWHCGIRKKLRRRRR
jgi:hypothetical protein